MNPGLASIVLTISRPTGRGGFSFSTDEPAPAASGLTLRARRLSNRPGSEMVEAGRLRDFQVARFHVRLAEWLTRYQDGDHLIEDHGAGRSTTWQVRTWAEVPKSRGLWAEIHAEEVRDV